MKGTVRGKINKGGAHTEGSLRLQVSMPLGLLHCNHSLNVLLEEDDKGSIREEVGDLVRNISLDDTRRKGREGFAASIIRDKLGSVFGPPPVPMGGGKRKSSCQTGPQDLQGDSHRLGVRKRCSSWAVVVSEVLFRDH